MHDPNFLFQILFGLQSFRYDNISIDLMIKMRLVNVLIERLDLNLKDLTESHDKKLKRPATNESTDTENNDESEQQEDLETPILKKMKLDYFPITMNVSSYDVYNRHQIVLNNSF